MNSFRSTRSTRRTSTWKKINRLENFLPIGMKTKQGRVGERGQIVIPAKMRRAFVLKPGKPVIFEEKEDGIMLKPEPDPETFVREFVSMPKKLPSIKDSGK